MGKITANLVTYILHPLMMPSFFYLLLMCCVPEALSPISGQLMLYVLLLIFITTFLIPVLSLLGLKSTSAISSLKLEKRQDRILPFIFITVFYGITSYMFLTRIDINPTMVVVIVSASILVVILTVITLFWKISLHAAGVGSITGYFLAVIMLYPEKMLYMPFSMLIFLSGLVIFARLRLNAHSSSETYTGYILGFLIAVNSLLWTS